MEPVRNFVMTFILMFFAVALSLTYFGFAAFYSLDLVAKVAGVIATLYTIGKYLSAAVARAFDPEKETE